MSDRFVIERARRRKEIFTNLDDYLRKLKTAVQEIDREAKLYIFGSVVRGEHVLMSDVDVLIVTEKPAAEVIASLWRRGFEEPFEFHVANRDGAEKYLRRLKDFREIV